MLRLQLVYTCAPTMTKLSHRQSLRVLIGDFTVSLIFVVYACEVVHVCCRFDLIWDGVGPVQSHPTLPSLLGANIPGRRQ